MASPQPRSATPSPPPPPPSPSNDTGLEAEIQRINLDASQDKRVPDDTDDIFQITPHMAIDFLSAKLASLIELTGDYELPDISAILARRAARDRERAGDDRGEEEEGENEESTTEVILPSGGEIVTNMADMQREKESIARSQSVKSLARLREQEAEKALQEQRRDSKASDEGNKTGNADDAQADTTEAESEENNTHVHVPAPSPTNLAPETVQQSNVDDDDMEAEMIQHIRLVKRFFSKRAPPFPVAPYLKRLHSSCPLSVGVYLATSYYIHRLAHDERSVPVTPRNVHRLVLGALRTAMKALEDCTYKQSSIARMGGVNTPELTRLEIGFCFLAGFDLNVTAEDLGQHWLGSAKEKEFAVEANSKPTQKS